MAASHEEVGRISTMTVEIAPGPASSGIARGVIEMSSFSIPSRISSLVSRLGLSALSISSAESPSTMPPAIRNAGRVTPKSLRMSPPAVAKTIRMTVEATDAFSAMARLFSGGSPAVIVRNDGMAARGSTMKKIEMTGMSHVSTKPGMVARLYPKDRGAAIEGLAILEAHPVHVGPLVAHAAGARGLPDAAARDADAGAARGAPAFLHVQALAPRAAGASDL